IGMVKVGVEVGLLPRKTRFNIDTPAGRVVATAHMNGEKVERVSFLNVPSFLLEKDLMLTVPEVGAVRCDIASGGAFYAYVDADSVGVELVPEQYSRLIDVGMRIKRAVMDSYEIHHPDGEADLNFLYGTIFVKIFDDDVRHSRNVCIFAEGEVDRSPTGTGVSGRLAIHHARGELALNQEIVVESLIGTEFTGRVIETTTIGNLSAIIPEVSGTAHITGRHTFWIDPDDSLKSGFILR
ncbi:MAG TPA: proline racemase family protein, partial [Aggregatilineales bacterium]|nr:proline racemase family protein [Aggregatilineales bacterium]